IAIVVLSQHVQRRYASELLQSGGGPDAGGVGYLLKQRVADSGAFCADVRRIAAGASVLDPEVVSAMLAAPGGDPLASLTERQREVLAVMAQGRSNAGIAERLFLTGKAVVKHVSHVYAELGIPPCADDHRRVLAVVRYLDRARSGDGFAGT